MAAATQTVNVQQPKWQTKAQKYLWKKTQKLERQGVPIYQGPRVAGLTDIQKEGVRGLAQTGRDPLLKGAYREAVAGNADIAAPDFYQRFREDPGFQAARTGMEQSIGQLLSENYLPSIEQGAVLAGGLGGSREGIAQGLAAQRAAQELASGLGQLESNIAGTALQAQGAALGRTPAMLQAAGILPNFQLQAGGIQQGQGQANIDARRQKFEEGANAPYFGLDQLRASLGLQPTGTGTTYSSQQTPGAGWGEIALATLLNLPGILNTGGGQGTGTGSSNYTPIYGY